MLKWIKRFFKGCLWSIAGSIVIIAVIIAIIYFTTPPVDKKKVADIERLAALGKDGVPDLLKYLDDKDGAIRYEAIYKLNDLRDPRIIEPMIKELKISDNEVPRKWAAQALGTLGDTTAVIPLIDALNDSSFHVRYKSADALGKIGDKRALNSLLRLSTTDDMEYVQIYAENAIIDICYKSGMPMPKIERKKDNKSIFRKIMDLINK
ncbi:HEAT repeat domain-containing protein [Candidatus Poribacteria bacterium]|nr:HEAT repeat domain-containing protein [Candidatus Poribacteria bacterium]